MESSNHLRALAHPVRLRILSLLTGADLTAADVARELGITHANASYHLRFLLDAGEIAVSGEESIRGGRARRYRHHWREEDRPQTGRAARPTPRRPRWSSGPRSRSSSAGIASAAAVCPGWSRMPSCGSTSQTWERARALLEEASAAPARRRSSPAHRRHRAGEPLPLRLRHGRLVSGASLSRPAAAPGVRLVPRLAHRQPARPDRRVGGDGLRRARPRGLGDHARAGARGTHGPDGRRAALRGRARRPVRPIARAAGLEPHQCPGPGRHGRAAHHRARRAVDDPAPPGGGRRGVGCRVPGDGRAWCRRWSRASSCSRPTPCSARPAGSPPSPGPAWAPCSSSPSGRGGRSSPTPPPGWSPRSSCSRCAATRRPAPRLRGPQRRGDLDAHRAARGLAAVPRHHLALGRRRGVRRAQRHRRRARGSPSARRWPARRSAARRGGGCCRPRRRGRSSRPWCCCGSPCRGRSWSAWSRPRCSASRW